MQRRWEQTFQFNDGGTKSKLHVMDCLAALRSPKTAHVVAQTSRPCGPQMAPIAPS